MEFRVELPKSQESCDANGIPPTNSAKIKKNKEGLLRESHNMQYTLWNSSGHGCSRREPLTF